MKCLQPQPLWVQSYQNCWHVFRGRAANRDLMWHCSCFMQKSIKLLKASAESKKTQDEKGQQFFGSSNVVAQILLPGLPPSLFSLNLFGLVWNESVVVLPQESYVAPQLLLWETSSSYLTTPFSCLSINTSKPPPSFPMSPGSFWAFPTFSHHWGHFYTETSEHALLLGQSVWAYETLFQKPCTCFTEPEFGVRSQARRQDMV